jgi:predicted ATPase
MIRELEIKNFKSHRATKLDIRNLTVLCGGNGVGKSSIMQILLLLREAYIKDKSFDILDLKSNPVKIGTANDAIYEFNTDEKDAISVSFNTDIGVYNFVYEANTEAERVKSFIRAIERETKRPLRIDHESLFNTNFQYISSARLGPQTQYSKDDKVIDVYKQISISEGKAEYFVHFLDANKNLSVIKDIQHPSSDLPELLPQVIAWEQEISEGVNIEIQNLGKLGFVLKYYFDTEASSTKRTKFFEATNVGFGLSYVMPILVAILSSKKDTLLFIENPEAHLHPNGIAKLTELICLAAQAGIQIILETHSDHVINGILVQSKRFEEGQTGIERKNVAIYHFDRDETKHCTDVKEIKIEQNGLIRYTPKGFFDQFTIDRKYLMGF